LPREFSTGIESFSFQIASQVSYKRGMEGISMRSREAFVAAAAALFLLAVTTTAVAIDKQDPADVQMFTQSMCVVSISAESKFVSLMDPDTEDPNAAVSMAFKTLPDAKAGDLVKLTPNTSGGSQPDVKVVEKAAKSCQRFLSK
jgi:hypothetical protein